MVPLLLAAALLPQTPLAVQTLELEPGPTLLVHRQESPVAALRLSASVPPDLPEGTVELLQELARPEAEATARRFGARLELRHQDGHAIIAVTGPAAAFDALVVLLRRAVAEPDLSVASLRRARARAEDRVLARLEQPGPRVRRLLRHALYGGPLPEGATATALGPESVRLLRARVYDPARTRVVVVAPAPDPVIRSAFSGWPTGPRQAGTVSVDTAAEPARPQAHREWSALGFPVSADPAVLDVTAELIRRRLRRAPLPFGAVEVWRSPAPALVLIGAALPGDSVVRTTAGITDRPLLDDSVALPAVGLVLRRLLAEAVALAGPEAVADARTAVARQLFMEARSPGGKAEVIGRIADRDGTAVSADDYLDRLNEVRLEQVRALLARLLDTPAVVAGAR